MIEELLTFAKTEKVDIKSITIVLDAQSEKPTGSISCFDGAGECSQVKRVTGETIEDLAAGFVEALKKIAAKEADPIQEKPKTTAKPAAKAAGKKTVAPEPGDLFQQEKPVTAQSEKLAEKPKETPAPQVEELTFENETNETVEDDENW